MASPKKKRTHLSAQGGATEHLRRANLSQILQLVHREGPQSRSSLTRSTGLNRSTVGALVAELVDLGLVFETAPTAGNLRGRPSPVVHADPRIVAIAVNPEVDAIHVGIVGLGGTIRSQVRRDVAQAPTSAEVVAVASSAVDDMLAGIATGANSPATNGAGTTNDRNVHVIGIGIAVPGQVRLTDGVVTEATHMGWRDEPLARLLADATGFPAFAANAANLGTRAENTFGAGRAVDDFIYFIGGASGIGGGAVSAGRLLSGSAGFAGELGHSFVRTDGAQCPCGATGCLEAEVTQSVLLDAVGLGAADAELLADRLLASTDPAVRRLVSSQLDLLGIAVRTAVNTFNPTLVILGGFLGSLYAAGGSGRDDRLLASTIRSARADVRIEAATAGTRQLMLGAAELVFAELLRDPAGVSRAADSLTQPMLQEIG